MFAKPRFQKTGKALSNTPSRLNFFGRPMLSQQSELILRYMVIDAPMNQTVQNAFGPVDAQLGRKQRRISGVQGGRRNKEVLKVEESSNYKSDYMPIWIIDDPPKLIETKALRCHCVPDATPSHVNRRFHRVIDWTNAERHQLRTAGSTVTAK